MPTGYTWNINNGIKFEDFVMQCSRAMGALIEMRDEPSGTSIPERFEPSDYHKEELTKANAEHEKLIGMSYEDASQAAIKECLDKLQAHEKRMEKKALQRMKYERMLSKVRDWEPPSCDHIGLKNFMIKQITGSINHDCDIGSYMSPSQNPLAGEEWKKQNLERTQGDIAYHAKGYAEEVARVEGRNQWLQQLRDSLTPKEK